MPEQVRGERRGEERNRRRGGEGVGRERNEEDVITLLTIYI